VQAWKGTGLSVLFLPYFSDHKAHLNPLICSKIENAPHNAVRLMYESGCASHLEPILCGKRCYLFNCIDHRVV